VLSHWPWSWSPRQYRKLVPKRWARRTCRITSDGGSGAYSFTTIGFAPASWNAFVHTVSAGSF